MPKRTAEQQRALGVFDQDHPLIGVRIKKGDQDVKELLRAAIENHFSTTPAKIFKRCVRLHLMPMYGHLKRVQAAVAEMEKVQ
jgi:hypothetical protein